MKSPSINLTLQLLLQPHAILMLEYVGKVKSPIVRHLVLGGWPPYLGPRLECV